MIEVITSTSSTHFHEESKSATPSEQYVEWENDINDWRPFKTKSTYCTVFTHLQHPRWTCTKSSIYICIYKYIYMHTYIHIYIYTYLHIYISTYIHIHIYIYRYIHTYMCIHKNIYTLIHIYIYIDT